MFKCIPQNNKKKEEKCPTHIVADQTSSVLEKERMLFQGSCLGCCRVNFSDWDPSQTCSHLSLSNFEAKWQFSVLASQSNWFLGLTFWSVRYDSFSRPYKHLNSRKVIDFSSWTSINLRGKLEKIGFIMSGNSSRGHETRIERRHKKR